jgi:hypothetical protein
VTSDAAVRLATRRLDLGLGTKTDWNPPGIRRLGGIETRSRSACPDANWGEQTRQSWEAALGHSQAAATEAAAERLFGFLADLIAKRTSRIKDDAIEYRSSIGLGEIFREASLKSVDRRACWAAHRCELSGQEMIDGARTLEVGRRQRCLERENSTEFIRNLFILIRKAT